MLGIPRDSWGVVYSTQHKTMSATLTPNQLALKKIKARKMRQASKLFVEKIRDKFHGKVSQRTELLFSPLAAAFKSIKMEAYAAKHPEAYAAMEDQIEAFGCDDAVNTFRDCVENMYPTGPDKREDFNEVCDTCDYCDARLLSGWDVGESPSGKTICRPCDNNEVYTSDEDSDEED